MPHNSSEIIEDISGSYFNLDTVLLPNPDHDSCEIIEPHIIIYADSTTDRVYAMNMKKDLKPKLFSYVYLIEQLKARVFLKGMLNLSTRLLLSDDKLTDQQKKARDDKMTVIRPIIESMEEFLISRSYGSKLVSDAFDDAVASGIKIKGRTFVYKLLYRYWRGGSRANAFLRKPGSGQGSDKKYKSKTGPRRNGTPFNGHMVNAEDKERIEKILRKHILISDPKSLPEAYDELNDKYYSDPLVDEYSGEIIRYNHWNDDRSISLGQFIYHADIFLNKNKDKVRKSQHKEIDYKKDTSGLSGNINDFFSEGPGHVYQVDETPLEIELVCEFDETRQTRVGKPTAYSVIDNFSKAIVALLLTLNHSSAHTALEIIFIAFRNKEKFCEELGVKLSHPWIQEGKCKIIFVDNAEFASELTRAFSRDAQITVMYNKEGQSQEKGAVERVHKTLQDFLYSLVPGVSKKTVNAYLKKQMRGKALINRVELYEILLEFICIRNEYYPLDSIVMNKKMRIDRVPKIPNRVWEWGLENRAGYLRFTDELDLQIQLLEVGEVTVHRGHLFLPGQFIRTSTSNKNSRGIRYVCDWTLDNGLQDVNPGKSLPRLQCRFKRYSMDRILIAAPDGSFKIAKMHPDEIKLLGKMDAEDIHREKLKISSETTEQKQIHASKQSVTRVKTKNIVAKAQEEQVPTSMNDANSQNITENRQRTIEHENSVNAKRFETALDELAGEMDPSNRDNSVEITAPSEQVEKSMSDDVTTRFRQLVGQQKSKKQ